MTARQLLPGEEAALDAFLARHAASSMFLRGNLARFGLTPSDHPHATTYWALGTPIRAVLGLTGAGVMLVQAPGATADDLTALTGATRDRRMSGLTGEATQIEALLAGLGLTTGDLRADSREPLCRLTLSDLPPASEPYDLRRPGPLDQALLAGWFLTYFRQIGFASPDPATEAAEVAARVEAALSETSTCRLLCREDRPLAMAALNARVARMVQVGGVYVPQTARGSGLGREVTRAVLAEARSGGATEAVLFANNPAALRAYQSIGFRQIGDYRITFLTEPVTLGAP